jgi:hypothetical protein
VRESAQSWLELLVDIKRRGLAMAPDLAVGDGCLGLWKALEEVFPSTRHQRCWVHKTMNVLNKVALSVEVNMKADRREMRSTARQPVPQLKRRLTPLPTSTGPSTTERHLPDQGPGGAARALGPLAHLEPD